MKEILITKLINHLIILTMKKIQKIIDIFQEKIEIIIIIIITELITTKKKKKKDIFLPHSAV